ncbi:hypothetical protein EVAR_10878_1 [Eumeta japonica]|uniref:Uncharacterized protein n=1 Tax=Eumeta variegata TaxID=151549 RepID=A0A4C1USU6_EUMVA|nr:hypothetical protein EVAR_10878_1 [Eumeta japonica]
MCALRSRSDTRKCDVSRETCFKFVGTGASVKEKRVAREGYCCSRRAGATTSPESKFDLAGVKAIGMSDYKGRWIRQGPDYRGSTVFRSNDMFLPQDIDLD